VVKRYYSSSAILCNAARFSTSTLRVEPDALKTAREAFDRAWMAMPPAVKVAAVPSTHAKPVMILPLRAVAIPEYHQNDISRTSRYRYLPLTFCGRC
jgi:hypothetical protein